MAFVCDVLAPTIVVPVEAHGWSDDRRRAVLLHEMAHVRRHDLIGHAIARLTCAVYWFHPLVWVAAHRLRAESERACDDLVLDSGMRASDYAQHLLDMVAGLGYDRGAPASALPMARRNEFEGRLHAILDRAKRRPTLGHTRFGVLAAVFGFLAMSVAAVAPVRRVAAPSAAAAARPFDDAPHINTSATLNPLGRNLDVTAQPAARDTTVIRGRVIGPDGMPIQNAFVTVTYPNGMLYSARTNADGRYLIAGVNSRDFTMVITATGLHIYGPVRWEREAASGHPEEFTIYDAVTGDSTGTRVYSKTFDDTVDWVPRYAADVVIDATLVKSSDPSAFQDYLPDYLPPVETTVALAPAATITGRVIDARTASPIPGVAVYMPNTTYKDSTTSEGTYTLKDVPYGIYELEARLSGYAPAHIVDLHVRQATVTADITMVKSGGSPPTTWQQTLDSVGFTARKAHNIGGWFYQDGEAVAYHAHFNGADIVRDTLFIGVGDGLFIGGAVTPIPGFAVIQSVDSGGAQVSVIRWRSPSTPGGACVSFWVNGQPSVESRPGQIDHVIDTKAGEAIEAYSPMDTPSEFFQPTRSDCATIVIWIRAAIH
jgi:hypothetical protein